MLNALSDGIRLIGKRLASRKDAVAVEITVKMTDGSEVRYNSSEDPDYAKKFQEYDSVIHPPEE